MSGFTNEIKDQIIELMVENDKKTNTINGAQYILKGLYQMRLITRLDLYYRIYGLLRGKFSSDHVSVSSFDCCLKAYLDKL